MKLPRVVLPAVVKKNLPVLVFVLLVPLGVLVGYFFSNIKVFVSGGYKGAFTPINKTLYVAKVDGVGIPRGEWEKTLKSRYGQTTAKDLIDIYMVKGALDKAGIKVSESEIDAEIATIEEQLGGQNLEDVLKQQGMTLEEFRRNISLQVGMKKLLSNKLVVTDQEVSDYMKAAGESLEGKTDEEKKINAKQALLDQKLSEEINGWFMDLQNKVKVENYLE